MSITPVEVRHAQLSRAPLGYSRRATDNLLEAVAQSYEQTWWERADLRDEVERLQAELARFKDMERLLRDTMMSAEKAAEDLRSQSAPRVRHAAPGGPPQGQRDRARGRGGA